ITYQIGINITDPEGTRALQYEASSDYMFPESEVTGTGIQNDIDTAFCHPISRPACHPCVFTDFEPNPNIIDVKDQVTDRPRTSVPMIFAHSV
ncbi:MAG: hypothetical protein ACK58T_03855, partial [Phycisphaerae bacterium]